MLLLTAAGAVMVGVVVIGDAWNYAQQLEPNQYKWAASMQRFWIVFYKDVERLCV